MDNRIKEALTDLALAVLKGLKIFLVYILPSAIASLLLSSELRDALVARPDLAALAPIINVVLVAIASKIKKEVPEESTLKRVL